MADIASQLQFPNYAQANQGLMGLVGMQGNLLQQQALRQQIGANMAASQAMQGAIDPQTGNIDMAKFADAMKTTPYAYNIPEYAQKVQAVANAQLQNRNTQLDVANKQLGYFDSQLGALVQMGDKVKPSDVIQTLARGVQSGMMPAQLATQYASEIPNDPAQLSGWVRQHWTALQGAKEQLALMPQGGSVNVGGQTVFTNRDPVTGQVVQAGALQNTLTPGEASTPVQGVTPTGATYVIPKAQWLAGQGQPGQSAQGSQGYTGRLNTAPQGQQTGLPPGALQTGLAPAQQAAMTAGAEVSAKGSAQAAQDLSNLTADAPMRINLLEQARSSLGNVTTGPGTDWRNTATSFMNSMPGIGAVARGMGLDPNNIKDYDEFKKIMTNYASSVSGAVGGGTDARLNAAITGNANPGISNLANDDILTKTIAAEKMRAAQSYSFQNSGLPPEQFNQWRSQWNKEVNPDAFVFASMTPQQQQAFIARKTKDGTLQQFKTDLFKAKPYLSMGAQ